jgi:DNA polymerase-3 subunit delta'
LPPSDALRLLTETTGADPDEAAAALAAAGGVVPRARDFLESPLRRTAREAVLRTLKDLTAADDLDVLNDVRSLLECVRAPLDDVKADQADERAERADFLGKSAMRSLEDRHRRELTAREREGIGEVLNVAESWLRDCLALSQGAPDVVVNSDTVDAMDEVAAVITPAAAVRALDAVNRARARISYNVSPQLAVEAMLFDVREVFRCPR